MVDQITAGAGSALRAYRNAGSGSTFPSIDTTKSQKASFSDFMKDAAGSAVETLRETEQVQLRAMNGAANTQQVVEAVIAAETTIQAVTAVRDRAVQAYQELLRMPV